MQNDFFQFDAYQIWISIIVPIILIVLWFIKRKIVKFDKVAEKLPETYVNKGDHEKDIKQIWDNHERDIDDIERRVVTLGEDLRRENKNIIDGVAYNKGKIDAVHVRLDDLFKWIADRNNNGK